MSTQHSTQFGSFSLERVYPQSREIVWAAWSTLGGKARWFAGGGGWTLIERSFDFRVGGTERAKGRWAANGTVSDFNAIYRDIVPNERIVYCYDMHLNDKHISVSLATVELKVEGKGTRLIVNEQAVFLDGYDDAGSRERGTSQLLDLLGKSLSD